MSQRSANVARLSELSIASGLGESVWSLYGLARSLKPETVVEIGSASGHSTCHIAMALQESRKGRLFAIDPHTKTDWNDSGPIDTYAVLRENLDRMGVGNRVEIVRSTSQDAARGWSRPIDLLFIDGDHSYEGVRKDWELFSVHMSPFGVVVFHDTLWDIRPEPAYAIEGMGVPRFVDELRCAGYPVITLDRNFGLTLVQVREGGIPLRG